MNPDPFSSRSPSASDDDLDVSLRSLLATAVATAPPAPSVDEIVQAGVPGAMVVELHPSRPWLRVGIGLAAAAALIGAVVAIEGRDTGTNHDNPPANAPTTPTPPLRGLSSHVLPDTVPAGWHLVDVVEAPYPSGTATQSGGQLFRRTSDGAAVIVYVTGSASGTEADAATATTAPAADTGAAIDRSAAQFVNGSARFTENGATVVVQWTGLPDTEAAAFLAQVLPTGPGAQLMYRSPNPDWALETSVPAGATVRDLAPFGALAYQSDAGDTVLVDLYEPIPGNELWHFGVPQQRDGATVYVSDRHASRAVGSLVASAVFDVSGTQPLARDAALSLVASLQPVADAAWTSAETELAAHYASVPTLSTLIVGGITVTRHLGVHEDAFCATNAAGLTRCHRNMAKDWGSGSLDDVNLDLTVGGTWVHVEGLSTDQPVTAAAVADRGRPATAWGMTLGGAFVVAVAPSDATTMSVSAHAPDADANQDAVRPIR